MVLYSLGKTSDCKASALFNNTKTLIEEQLFFTIERKVGTFPGQHNIKEVLLLGQPCKNCQKKYAHWYKSGTTVKVETQHSLTVF